MPSTPVSTINEKMTRHLVKWWRNSQLGHSPSRRRALIVVRQSPNWEDGASILDAAETYDRLIGRPIGFARGFIELWNKTFATTYFQVRQNLKEITLANFMAVKGADCVRLNELLEKPEIAADIILFSDDDDWFNPVIVRELEGVPVEIGGVTWPSVRYDGAFQLRKDIYCYTNNYAVLAPAQKEPNWVELYAQHGGADACFHQRAAVKTKRMELLLSVTNKHPASTVTIEKMLAKTPGRDGLVQLVDEYVCRGKVNRPAPELHWSEQLVAQAFEVFSSLKTR
jgi:hypothetical protein